MNAVKWEVLALDKRGRPASVDKCGRPLGVVFVTAKTAEGALACGKLWRRALSFPKTKNLIARRYYPELDLSMSSHIVRVCLSQHTNTAEVPA